MRPLELRLRGFRSYPTAAEAVFDFRNRRLVGIVGPIGSGKSTILDGIAFALYGRTPRVGKATRDLIHQRADAGAVAFRFAVDGQVWEAVRSLRRKGASQHALYRLAEDAPDAEITDRITQEKEVNAAVVGLLGLEFDAFGRSVLLAQNRFAEFLEAQPRHRDEVLKGVFGHHRIDAMREAARRRAAEASVEVDRHQVRLESFEKMAAKVAAQQEELGASVARLESLDKAEPEITGFDEAIAAGGAAGAAATARLEELRGVESRLPEAKPVAALAEAREKAGAARARAAARLEEAEAAAAAARRSLDEMASAEELLERASALLATLDRRREAAATAGQRLAAAAKRLDDAAATEADVAARQERAAKADTSAAEALAEADAAVAAAEADLHAARHRDMAVALRSGLSTGDSCPVCEQTVAEIPAASGPDLDGAEQRVTAARDRRKAAERVRSRAAGELQAAQEAVAAAGRSLQQCADELEAARAAAAAEDAAVTAAAADLAELIDADDPAAAIQQRREALRTAREEVERARRAVDEARRRHDEAIAAEQDADRDLSGLRMRLTEVATRLGLGEDMPGDASGLAVAAASLRTAWQQAVSAARDAIAEAEAGVARARDARAGLLVRLDVTDGDFTTALAAVRARVGLLTEEIDAAAAELAAAGETRRLHAAATGRMQVMQRLTTDLTDAKFIRFLLDEERALLAELGSEHFQRLSGGRYRFTEDGAFNVVDLTTADAERRSDSLSGGETFLASLGLALGLAEMVSREGSRLDAFLLDEGFGSLDAEHLDLAMEGVERLAAGEGDRLVVVVSHVPEMRERVEDLIVLDRDPLTGDTRVRRS